MSYKARWYGEPYHDFTKKRWLITFEVEATPSVYDKLKDKPLSLDINEYKEGRSLNANRYFYQLVNKIAKALDVTDSEVHDRLLSENLCFIKRDGVLDWKVTPEKPNKYRLLKKYVDGNYDYWYDSGERVRMTEVASGKILKSMDDVPIVGNIYLHVKGSRLMDTKEMSRLIDSTVQEAKQLDIETLTPDELERLVKAWNPS